jgi:hypothetical protein
MSIIIAIGLLVLTIIFFEILYGVMINLKKTTCKATGSNGMKIINYFTIISPSCNEAFNASRDFVDGMVSYYFYIDAISGILEWSQSKPGGYKEVINILE